MHWILVLILASLSLLDTTILYITATLLTNDIKYFKTGSNAKFLDRYDNWILGLILGKAIMYSPLIALIIRDTIFEQVYTEYFYRSNPIEPVFNLA